MSVVHKVTEREMQSTPKFLSDVTVACVIPVFGRVECGSTFQKRSLSKNTRVLFKQG